MAGIHGRRLGSAPVSNPVAGAIGEFSLPMRVRGWNLTLTLRGNSTARAQILLRSFREGASPSPCRAGCFQAAFPAPSDIFRPFSWEERGLQLCEHTRIHGRSPRRRLCPRPLVARGSAWLCCMGLLVPGWSWRRSLDAYLNRLDLGAELGFGSDQQPSLPLFACRSIRVFLAVKRVRGCRQGFSCAGGELVLKNSWVLGRGVGTGAVIKYDGERSDLLRSQTPFGRGELSYQE